MTGTDPTVSAGGSQSVSGARVHGNLIQVQAVTGNVTINAPSQDPVSWPVRVGAVPSLASAFQERLEVRRRVTAARERGAAVVLTQVLAGGGGTGKSQLAASYADRAVRKGTDLVLWVDARAREAVITAYAQAASRVHIPGIRDGSDPVAAARIFLDWLSTTSRCWLVVLDDIIDPQAIVDLWPTSHTGTGWVLATTRRRDPILSGGGRSLVEVDVYAPEESAIYLFDRLSGANASHLLDGAATILAEAVGHLPLALSHAAAFMIAKQVSCRGYVALFSDANSRLERIMPRWADTEAYGRTVAATLLLSLDAAEAIEPKGLARSALRLASVLHPAGHPEGLWASEAVTNYLTAHRSQIGIDRPQSFE